MWGRVLNEPNRNMFITPDGEKKMSTVKMMRVVIAGRKGKVMSPVIKLTDRYDEQAARELASEGKHSYEIVDLPFRYRVFGMKVFKSIVPAGAVEAMILSHWISTRAEKARQKDRASKKKK